MAAAQSDLAVERVPRICGDGPEVTRTVYEAFDAFPAVRG